MSDTDQPHTTAAVLHDADKANRNALRRAIKQRHSTATIKGYKALKQNVKKFMLDGRSQVSRELRAVRNEIARDLGGADQLSASALILVDTAAKSYLLLEAVDGWLFTTGKLIDKRHRQVHKAAMDRMRLADSLSRQLSVLGLEKKLPARRLNQ